MRKGALTAFRSEGPMLLPDDLEARQLKAIVFRENADSLYAHDESAAKTVSSLISASLPDVDLSLDFLDDTAFLDFFNFSDPSDTGAGLLDGVTEQTPLSTSQEMQVGPSAVAVDQHPQLPVSEEGVRATLKTLPVCSPCKKRRIKCDMLLPSCRNCTKLHKDCQYWDAVLCQEIPRK